MFRKLLNLFGLAAVGALPSAVIEPANKIKHATQAGTSRKRWRQMSRPIMRGAGFFTPGGPIIHKQQAWLERCKVRVSRWYRHHPVDAKRRPPGHIQLMMYSLSQAYGKHYVEDLVRLAVNNRSYGH